LFSLVLVEPQDLVNIASAVRIAKNFAIDDVRLVRPAEFDAWRIEGIAHNTADLVERITFHDSLEAALADVVWAAALTARGRAAKRTMARPRAAAEEMVARSADGSVAIVAGREDKGLNNDELDRCQALVSIATNPAHSSLNLAQAVAVMAHELFVAREGEVQPFKRPRRSAGPATSEQLEALFTDWASALHAIDFFKARGEDAVMRVVREAFYRAELDGREAALLRAMGIEVRKKIERAQKSE
jgi:TrmH family RNA methyltransferase